MPRPRPRTPGRARVGPQAASKARSKQYQRDYPHVLDTTPTYARPTDPFPAYQPSEHEVTCSSCGGSG